MTVGAVFAPITISSVPGQLFISVVLTLYLAGPVTVVELPITLLLHVIVENASVTESVAVSSGHKLILSVLITGSIVLDIIIFITAEVFEHPNPDTSE